MPNQSTLKFIFGLWCAFMALYICIILTACGNSMPLGPAHELKDGGYDRFVDKETGIACYYNRFSITVACAPIQKACK